MNIFAPELSALMTILVGRAGDLDAAVLEIGRSRRHAPVALADRPRLLEEVGQLAVPQPVRPLLAGGEQRLALRAELALEQVQELGRFRGEDVVGRHGGLGG